MSRTIVKLSKVVKKYRVGKVDFPALNGFDLEVRQGDFVTLTGPSGCGKTTALNLIGCIDTPTKGQVEVLGVDVSKASDFELSRLRLKKIGFVFQNFNLIPVLSCLENIAYPLTLRGDKDAKSKAFFFLKKVGLTKFGGLKPGELSGGQRQRCAIARAFAGKPDIILADEPTANLDSENSQRVLELIFDFAKELKTTFVAVSHHSFFIENSTRVVKIKDGRLLSDS